MVTEAVELPDDPDELIEYARSGIGHGDAPYNPYALAALAAAEKYRDMIARLRDDPGIGNFYAHCSRCAYTATGNRMWAVAGAAREHEFGAADHVVTIRNGSAEVARSLWGLRYDDMQ